MTTHKLNCRVTFIFYGNDITVHIFTLLWNGMCFFILSGHADLDTVGCTRMQCSEFQAKIITNLPYLQDIGELFFDLIELNLHINYSLLNVRKLCFSSHGVDFTSHFLRDKTELLTQLIVIRFQF